MAARTIGLRGGLRLLPRAIVGVVLSLGAMPSPVLAAGCRKVAEAEKLVDQGKYQAALPVAKAAAADCRSSHAKGARPYVTLGKIYNELKKYDLAAENYEEAIKQEPNLGLAYFSLGGIYSQLSRYPEAIDTIQKSLKLRLTKEEQAKAYFNLGFAYFSLAADKSDTSDRRSEEWFEKSRKLDPKIAQNHYFLGVLQELSYRNLPAAKPLYKKSCDLGFSTGCEWYRRLVANPKTGNSGPESASEQPTGTASVAAKEYPYTKAEEASLARIEAAYRKKGLTKALAAESAEMVRTQLRGIDPKDRKQPLETIASSLAAAPGDQPPAPAAASAAAPAAASASQPTKSPEKWWAADLDMIGYMDCVKAAKGLGSDRGLYVGEIYKAKKAAKGGFFDGKTVYACPAGAWMHFNPENELLAGYFSVRKNHLLAACKKEAVVEIGEMWAQEKNEDIKFVTKIDCKKLQPLL